MKFELTDQHKAEMQQIYDHMYKNRVPGATIRQTLDKYVIDKNNAWVADQNALIKKQIKADEEYNKQIQEERDAAEKARQEKITNAKNLGKEAMISGDSPDVELAETAWNEGNFKPFIDKNSGDLAKWFEDTYPDIFLDNKVGMQAQSGEIVFTINGEEIEIDLNPDMLDYPRLLVSDKYIDKELQEELGLSGPDMITYQKFRKVKKLFDEKVANQEEIANREYGYNLLIDTKGDTDELGGFFKAFEQDDLNGANNFYKKNGVNVSIQPTATSTKGRGQGYSVTRDGEVIFEGNTAEIKNFLSKDDTFTDDEKDKMDNAKAEIAKREKKLYEEIQQKNPNITSREDAILDYAKSPRSKTDLKIVTDGISEEGYAILEKHLNTEIKEEKLTQVGNRSVMMPVTVDGWEKTRYETLFNDEIREQLSDEDKLIFDQAKLRRDKQAASSIDEQHQFNLKKSWDVLYNKQNRESGRDVETNWWAESRKFDLYKQGEIRKQAATKIDDKFLENQKKVIQQLKRARLNAQRDGVGVEMKKLKDGSVIYKAFSNNPNNPALKYHQEKFNQVASNEAAYSDLHLAERKVWSKEYMTFLKDNQDDQRINNILTRENDLSNILLNEWSNAWENIGYSIPALFGNKNAITMHASRLNGKEYYEQAMDYKTAKSSGQLRRQGLITLAQQMPNVLLAVGTQGAAGLALGSLTSAATLSATNIASALTATAFGVNAGGSKRADLTIQQNAAEYAKEAKEELMANKANMSPEDYYNKMASLEQTIMLGDMSDNQIILQSLASGAIEGGIAFALGTIPNSSKAARGLIGSSAADDIMKAITLNNTAYIANSLGQIGLRTAGEVVEELAIHFGDAASEALILNRDFDYEGWDDVIFSSIITGGTMNIPGVAVPAIHKRLFNADIANARAKYQGAKNRQEELLMKAARAEDETAANLYREAAVIESNKMARLSSANELATLLLGGKKMSSLMRNGYVLDSLYDEAGVVEGDSYQVREQKVQAHKDSLQGEALRDYETRLEDALERDKDIINSIDYKDGWRAWGPRGQAVHEQLLKTDSRYKDLSDQEKALMVHETIKEDMNKTLINRAKKTPGITEMIENDVYGAPFAQAKTKDGKKRQRRAKKAEDAAYLRAGRLFAAMTGNAIAKNTDQQINAEQIFSKQGKGAPRVVQVSDKGFEYDIRKFAAENKLSEQEMLNVERLIEEVRSGETNGAYLAGPNVLIAADASQATKLLNQADPVFEVGTVWAHETRHASDVKAFTPDELAVYTQNLALWIKENAPHIYAQAMSRFDNVGAIDPNINWLDQSLKFHLEFGTYVEDAIDIEGGTVNNGAVQRKLAKAKPDILTRGKALVNSDFDINTPEAAAYYFNDFRKNFQKGKESPMAKARIKARRKKGIETIDNFGVLKSKSNLQAILDRRTNNNPKKSDISPMIQDMFLMDSNGESITDSNNRSAFESEVGGIIESITKRLYDPIPQELRKGLPRQDYKQTLLTDAADLLIREYDPALQNMDKFLSNRLNLRAKSLATRLGVEDRFLSDLDNANRVLADDDTDVEFDDEGNVLTPETPFTDGLAFTPQQLKTVLDHVKLNLGSILPSITAERGKNAVVSPLVSALKKEFYKEKNPIQQAIENIMGKTPAEVEIFLKDPKNKALILKHMPTTWLAKNLPKAVQKLVIQEDGTKVWTTDFQGRTKGTKPGQIDFYRSSEEGPYKGMTDGKQKIRRNPRAMSEISSIDIIKKFFNGTTMTELRRGGLDTLTRAMAQEIGLEQFRSQLVGETDIADVFKSRQELLYGELADNAIMQTIEQIERGNVLKSDKKIDRTLIARNYDKEGVSGLVMPVVRNAIINGIESENTDIELAILEAQYPGLGNVAELILEDLYAGNVSKDNIKFLEQIINYPDMPAELTSMIKNKAHQLRGKDKKTNANAQRYSKMVNMLVNDYGMDKGFIDALGGDMAILGYFNRALDAAKNSAKYEGEAPYYRDQLKNKGKLTDDNTGYESGDIILANKKNTKLRKMYTPLLHSNAPISEKLAALEKIKDSINKANISNLGHLKYFWNKINQAYRDGKVKDIDLVTLAQIQTNIVSGTRALSGIDYFMFGNYIDNTKFKLSEINDNYDAFVNKLSEYDDYSFLYPIKLADIRKKNPNMTDAEVERAANIATYKGLVVKGEHIGASANTSADIITSIINGEYNDSVFDDIHKDHTQFFGPKYVMDIIDELGQTSRLGHLRITQGLKSFPKILERIYHVSGQKADARIADLNNINDLFKTRDQVILETKLGNLNNDARTLKSANRKGISILDFDDTLATSKSLVRFTRPDGTTGTLTPAQYAAEYESLADLGYTFDFSEFNKVVNGKIAPLFNKALKLQEKFGTNDIFILTARPHEAQRAIHTFLKDNGLNIPINNITGLGNSTAEAKALWVADKAAEGYNDFYFADDALKNVQAVKNILDQFDVKSKVRQAYLKSDRKAKLNSIIARNLNIPEYKEYSDAKAKLVGKKKGRFKFFIPPSAEDFKGLIYPMLGKGALGDADMQFFKEVLFDPYSRGVEQMNRMAQGLSVDYKALNKLMPKAKRKLNKKIPGTEFTYDQGVRVWMWTKAGVEVPGISKADIKEINKAINDDQQMVDYANGILRITKSPSYVTPTDNWLTSTVAMDLYMMTQGDTRKQMLSEYIENRRELFGDWKGNRLDGPLMNKLEAALGTNWRDAFEDVLWRMENGTNRNFGTNKLTNRFTNWVNNSVGAIMFFNGRSAVLQTLSTVNFINWSDNNILAAAKAFANQKQFWKDFTYLFNSDMLKQRRSGNRRSVSENEIAQMAERSGVAGVLNKLLEFGFLPTQIADSFAIASGGASFYRNRINTYLKDGLTQQEAEQKAFTDFQKITEETQQSSRPDMISSQQASPLGRLILAFQNTPMQYARLTKKAILDLKNGRGDARTNISKIMYYGAIQNIIFGALQQALFRFMFDNDEEEKEKAEEKERATLRLANGVIDSFLRGIGVAGAIVATLKNMVVKFIEEDKKGFRMDTAAIILEMLQISPPVGSKVRKVNTGLRTYKFKRREIDHMDKFDIDNPIWSPITQTISALTNIPTDRVYKKIMNLREAANSDNDTWQRIAMLLGWNTWDVGVRNQEVINARGEIEEIRQQKKAEEKKQKEEQKRKEREERRKREVQCSARTRKGKGPRCKNRTENKNGRCYAHQ